MDMNDLRSVHYFKRNSFVAMICYNCIKFWSLGYKIILSESDFCIVVNPMLESFIFINSVK